MLIVAAIVATLLAIAAARAGRFRKLLAITVACALVFGCAVVVFLLAGPKDYLISFPFLTPVLHPWLLALYSMVAFFVTGAILLGIVLRTVFDWVTIRLQK